MRRGEKAALVIFARQPRGRVKTRLVPALGAAAARAFHLACLQTTARLASSQPASIAKWLYFTGRHRAPASRTARALRLPRPLRLRVQGSGDLGARLERAFKALHAAGYHSVVVIGTDSPTLTRQRLRQAFGALRRTHAVLGPARDGGYYLIGLRAGLPAPAKIFRGIGWGTRHAFRQTRARLRDAGLRTVVLAPGYDVDTPADLRRLQRDLRRRATRRQAHLQPLRAWFAQQQSYRQREASG